MDALDRLAMNAVEGRRPILETIGQIVEALGGTSNAAATLHVVPSAVSNWKVRGHIPSHKFLVISEALKRKGKKVSPSVFGFVEVA